MAIIIQLTDKTETEELYPITTASEVYVDEDKTLVGLIAEEEANV